MLSVDQSGGAPLGALCGVTIVGPDLDSWATAYQEGLEYRGRGAFLVDAARANTWRCSAAEGCRTLTLRPASDNSTFVRFVESAVEESLTPLAMSGWSAAEIVVQDLDALARRLDGGPFHVLAPPAVVDLPFTDQIRAMQVAGPAGEVLYLTEINGPIPGFDLPKPQSFVDRVFVGVLATLALDQAAAWHAAVAHTAASPPLTARIAAISETHGLDRETRYRLRTLALPGASLIEIDEFPPTTKGRPRAACGLPAGIAMVSFVGDRHCVLEGPDGELVEFLPEAPAS